MRNLLSCVAISVAILTGCSDDDETQNQPADASTAAMTEAQIAGVVSAINRGEIEQGQLATTKAVRSEVKAFANMMIMEHETAQQRQEALFARLGITPVDSPTSTQVKTDAGTELTKLQAATGSTFDEAYKASQVTMHQKALNLLDTMLIPSARTADVRAELQTARASVATHLTQAQMLATGNDAGTSETGTSDTGTSDTGTGETGVDSSVPDSGSD